METLVKDFAGKPVRVFFEEGLAPQASALLDQLAEQHAGGMSIRPGMRIRIGWTFLVLQERAGEVLVCEPDYAANPFTDLREDVSIYLRVWASQFRLVQMLGVTPVEVSFQDKIIYSQGVFQAAGLYAERIQPLPDKHDSGWFFGFIDGDNSEPNLLSGYVFELLAKKPLLMQTLMLPPGCIVAVRENQIVDIVDRSNKSLLGR